MFEDYASGYGYDRLAQPAPPAPPRAAPPQAPPPPRPQMGASPDGLGSTMTPMDGYGMGAALDFMEPRDVSPQATVRSAGFTALGAALAFGVGLAAGGPWGGLSGILLSGSVFNLNRAQKWWSSRDPSEKHEAVVSGVMGMATLAFGGYSAYKAYKSKE